MKIVAIVFCFFIFKSVSAQSRDTLGRDTAKPLVIVDAKPVNKHVKPLYVVNGIVYKGNIRKINPDDIVQIDVLKQPESIKIYGKGGENGVVLITTKANRNIKVDKKVDTTGKHYTEDPLSNPKYYPKPIYIIDGKLIAAASSDSVIRDLNPNKILDISVLKDSALDRTSSAGFHGRAVVITTKKYAILQYQKKFSAFSKAYNNYIDSLKSDDQQVTYVINGELVAGKDRNDEISQLYKIPKEKIKGIGFQENPWYNGSPSKKYLLIIASKQ